MSPPDEVETVTVPIPPKTWARAVERAVIAGEPDRVEKHVWEVVELELKPPDDAVENDFLRSSCPTR